MSETDTIQYNNGIIVISADLDPLNPREDYNLFTMVCWHRKYWLGDKNDFRTPDDFHAWWKQHGKGGIISKLWLFDHSGITIAVGENNPFSCQWDSGQVGYTYATADDLRMEYNAKRLSPRIREEALKTMRLETELYDAYLTGEVYEFTTYYKNMAGGQVEIDQGSGYCGYDFEKNGLMSDAKASIDLYILKREKQLALPRNQVG